MFKKFTKLFCISLLIFNLSNAQEPPKTEVAPPVLPQLTPTTVGAVLGLTGFAALHGEGIRQGMELAMKDLSVHNELRLKVNYQDDQTLPVQTMFGFKQLAALGTKYFIGPTWSFQIKAIKSFVTQSNLLAISPSGSSEVADGGSPGVFFLSPQRAFSVPTTTAWLNQKKFKTAYLLIPNAEWGIANEAAFKTSLTQAGVNLLGIEHYDYTIDQAGLTPLIMRIKSKKPDLIMLTAPASILININKIIKTLHIESTIFCTENAFELVSRKLINPEELTNWYALSHVLAPEFIELYRKTYNARPLDYAPEGYDALVITNQLVQKFGDDTAAAKKFLYGSFDYTGMSGRIRFNQDGDRKEGEFVVENLGGVS